MVNDGKLKIVLFGLPGFGNPVLEALLHEDRVQVEAVFTVHYDQPFPYYTERQLTDLCRERGVTCYAGIAVSSPDGLRRLQTHAPDLIVVATFKQILKKNVLQLPKLGVVNFHPSLLPKYRGACPTNAALATGERYTGITVHYVTEELDAGNILLQRPIPILATDSDGQLRRKLAQVAGELIPEVVTLFTRETIPAGTPQNHSMATFAPKPTIEDGYLELADDIEAMARKMKAYNPLPGTSILINQRRIKVDQFEIGADSRANGLYVNDKTFDWVSGQRAIRLFRQFDSEG